MGRILSYFKKHIFSIIMLIVILGIQVRFELLLPQYTSDIVNIGIQQEGFESSVPKVVDESTYAIFLSLADKNDKVKIAKSYEYWVPNSNSGKNKKIKEQNKNIKILPEKMYSKNFYVLKGDIKEKDIESNANNAFTNYARYIASQNNDKKIKSLDGLVNEKKIPEYMKKQIGIKMVKSLYNSYGINVKGSQKKYLWKTGTIMIIIAILSGLASILVSFISAKVSAKVSKDVRRDSFEKVMSFSNLEMDKFSIASLITRCTNDIQQIQQSSVMVLRFIFYGPIMAVGAFVNVYRLNISMLWIIALSIFVTLVSIFLIMRKAIPKFKITQVIIDKLNLVTREFISGIEVNRVFRTNKYEEERFDTVNKELTTTNLYTTRIMSLMQPFMMFVMNATTLLIIWVGAKNIEAGVIQVGDMMAFIQYTIQIIMAFLFISMISVILPRAMISANRIGEVLECEISIKDNGKISSFDREGSLEFKNVSFRYDGAMENVLNDISFSTKKGKVTAIIGSTGAGKSTIVNLIPRFLDVSSGEISLNGVNIKDIPMKILREKVSIVPQKSVLFSGNIASNIEYARDIRDNKRMSIASEISQSQEFIKKKDNGYASVVSQGGANLSGGQKQRISIARAIARDSEIIVFDDSFSALDAKTDRKLRSEIKKNLYDKALIIVAQRINTIMDADEIIVLENGYIVGKGTHDELIKSCQIYYEIAKSQLTEEELKNESKK